MSENARYRTRPDFFVFTSLACVCINGYENGTTTAVFYGRKPNRRRRRSFDVFTGHGDYDGGRVG